MKVRYVLGVVWMAGVAAGVGAAEDGDVFRPPAGYPDPARFEADIRAFAEADAAAMPAPGGVVGVGSSSMRLWHPWLDEDLAPLEVIPRGFGGSTFYDLLHYLEPLVLRYQPRAILLYEGDNDIASGVSPEGVLRVFDTLRARLQAALPEVRLYVLAVKPSPARWEMWPRMQAVNAGLAARCALDPRLTFVDGAAPLLGDDGMPRREFFVDDVLHLNRQGYLAWRDALRPMLLPRELRAVQDRLVPLDAGAVRLEGHVAERLAACLDQRILGVDPEELVRPFRERKETRLWQTEFWGKWFTSAVLAYHVAPTPALKKRLDEAIAALLATQTEDGYIGTYAPEAETEHWDVWGRKYTLLGLLDSYDLTGDGAVLTAARRHADHLLTQVGPDARDIVTLGWWSGMAAGSILQPMVRLYGVSGDPRYLAFAQYIVDRWESDQGPRLVQKARAGTPVFDMFAKPIPNPKEYGDHGQSKAYEMMSCYEGLLELHRTTGTPAYRDAAERVYAGILEREITVVGSGSHMERWCDGQARQLDRSLTEWMETCVTVTWMKFADELFRLSGDAAYLDAFERSALNALLGALPPDASWWSHYMPMDGVRGPAPEQCDMHMNCCVANGPRGLFLIPRVHTMQGADGPVVNLYLPGTACAAYPGGRVELRQTTDFPRSGAVTLTVNPDPPGSFPLQLRIPSWSRQTTLHVNGEPVPTIEPGTYARIERAWQTGDTVTIQLDMRGRIEPAPAGAPYAAILRGPIVLAMDHRFPQPVDGLGPARFRTDPDGSLPLALLPPSPDAWLLVEAPIRDDSGREGRLTLCDFSSAGQTWDEASRYQTWIPTPVVVGGE
jgi:hypothetical protein